MRRFQGNLEDLNHWRESVNATALGLPTSGGAAGLQPGGSATPAGGESQAGQGTQMGAAGEGEAEVEGGTEAVYTAWGRAVLASGRASQEGGSRSWGRGGEWGMTRTLGMPRLM